MSSDELLFVSDEEIIEDIIQETPQKTKLETVLSKRHRANKKIICKESQLSISGFEIYKPNYDVVSDVYIPPYVFYEIRQILKFTEQCNPINSKIKLFGIYAQNKKLNYLLEPKEVCTKLPLLKILLDFSLLCIFPEPEKAIEVYGFINFDTTNRTVYFVVQYWSLIDGNPRRYLQNLRFQRAFVPDCYLKMKTSFCILNTTEIFNSICIDLEKSLFFQDDFLINYLDKIEEIENILSEEQQIMNISADIFK